MSRFLLLVGVAALLTASAQPVLAQNKTPPDTSVRALEPPIDVTKGQDTSLPATQSPTVATTPGGAVVPTGTGPSAVPGAGGK